jgi:glycosyltransferase involved in cell wall biosynthesis
VQRPVKFVKYLREFGWEPLVLAVANPSVPVLDPSLLLDIPEGVKVYRAHTLEPGYALKQSVTRAKSGFLGSLRVAVKRCVARLLLPDVQVLWWPGLLSQLCLILVSEMPAVVLVSAPPFSSFVPVVFAARLFGVPVVLDYRDEWTFTRRNWEHSVKGKFVEKVDAFLERYALEGCSAFVTANESYVRSLSGAYPKAADKGCAVTNGYDEDDLQGLQLPSRQGKAIRITYAGTVWNATSLKPFLAALELLFDRNETLWREERVVVEVYGRVVEEEQESLARHKYAAHIRLNGYAQHHEIMRELMDSDVLLLTLSDLPGAERIVTGKAFEYMATGRHIMAVVPEGETSRLLRKNYRNLTLVTDSNPEAICTALSGIASAIDELRIRPREDVSRFTRKNLTGDLSRLFDRLASQPLPETPPR